MNKLLLGLFGVAVLSVAETAANAQAAHTQRPKPALGITMSDNTLPGVLVMNVVPDSPAARIGLQTGDRILAINGKPTSTFHDVSRIIDASGFSAPIELTVARGAWQGKFTAQLGSEDSVFSPTALRSLRQPAQVVAPPVTVYYVPVPSRSSELPKDGLHARSVDW